jgi:hypothetical protein
MNAGRRERLAELGRRAREDAAAGRFPGLENIVPGTPYRLSQFRPRPGTPKFAWALAQAKTARQFKRDRRAEARQRLKGIPCDSFEETDDRDRAAEGCCVCCGHARAAHSRK